MAGGIIGITEEMKADSIRIRTIGNGFLMKIGNELWFHYNSLDEVFEHIKFKLRDYTKFLVQDREKAFFGCDLS